jgi:hypothetical protein
MKKLGAVSDVDFQPASVFQHRVHCFGLQIVLGPNPKVRLPIADLKGDPAPLCQVPDPIETMGWAECFRAHYPPSS